MNDVSDFVLQIQDFNKINEQFQSKRDQTDLYGQFYGVLANTGTSSLRRRTKMRLRMPGKELLGYPPFSPM